MVDTFVTQFDGCNYLVDGKPSGGKNCTMAVEAMFLYRASGGKIVVTSCQCRMRSGDRSGGTHLGQAEEISKQYGITAGRVYRPLSTASARSLLETGRYGTHWNGSNSAMIGTPYDNSGGRFRGNHDWWVSGMGTEAATYRVADPQRKHGYQDIPISLMEKAASRLDVSDITEPYRPLGAGKVYCYFTPPDELPPVNHQKAVVTRTTQLWNDQGGYWVYKVPVNTKLEVRGRQFPKGGVATYPVTCGTYACNYPGYYVPVKNVKLGGRV